VGIYAIQFAKVLELKVYANASGKNDEILKNLGLTGCAHIPTERLVTLTGVQFYDFTQQPIHKALVQNLSSSKFDIFLEAVGHACVLLFTHSEAYFSPNRIYISVGPTSWIRRGLERALECIHASQVGWRCQASI